MTEYELYEFELKEENEFFFDWETWEDLASLEECDSPWDALDYILINE